MALHNHLVWVSSLRQAIRRAFPEATKPIWGMTEDSPLENVHPRLSAYLPGMPGVTLTFDFPPDGYWATMMVDSGGDQKARRLGMRHWAGHLIGWEERTSFQASVKSLPDMIGWLSVARTRWLEGLRLNRLQAVTLIKPLDARTAPSQAYINIRKGAPAVVLWREHEAASVWFLLQPLTTPVSLRTADLPRVRHWCLLEAPKVMSISVPLGRDSWEAAINPPAHDLLDDVDLSPGVPTKPKIDIDDIWDDFEDL